MTHPPPQNSEGALSGAPTQKQNQASECNRTLEHEQIELLKQIRNQLLSDSYSMFILFTALLRIEDNQRELLRELKRVHERDQIFAANGGGSRS
jgi:hypothetical protein